MNTRTFAFTALLVATTIAFGGISDSDGAGALFVEPASASCTDFGFGCTESQVCTAINKVTGKPQPCVE